MSGMFLADHFPAVVLFDSGASHTFISNAYVSRCGFEVSNLKQGYRIVAPGSPIEVNRIVWQLSLKIGGKNFFINPLVLPHQGVDIIIGMNWMKEHRVVLDLQCRTVQLQPTSKDPVMLVQLPTNETLSQIVNATSAEPIKEVPVVCDFTDVFPADLPGLPPDRDVEFTIELLPGTTPISRRPYRMGPEELKELKIQLQELLDKGFIHPSSSPWGCPALFVDNKDNTKQLCVDYRPLND